MSLELLESHMFNGTWVTQGRLAMLVGADEAKDMIESGELKQKDKGRRRLYFFVEEQETRGAAKKKKIQQQQQARDQGPD